MKTSQILDLDFRKEENKKIIQKVLRKIKPLSRFSDEEIIPIEMLEKTICTLVQKYEIEHQWINVTYLETNSGIYSVGVKSRVNHEWLGNVYGICIYELLAKLTIKLYSEIKSKQIPIREKSEAEN